MLQISAVKLRQSLLLFCMASVVLIADQVTKFLVRANLDLHESTPEDCWCRLTYSTNSGSVFGLDINSTLLLVMAPIVILVILWLYFYYLPLTNRVLRIGLGLLLGGAFGNLIDRIRFGEVTDFLYVDLGFWPLDPWPTFNVADASITGGIFIMIFCIMREAATVKNSSSSNPDEE